VVTAGVVITRIVGTGRGIGQSQGRAAEPPVFRASCPPDALPAPASYAFCMSDSPLSRQEIHAAAAAHDELGPEYSDAVVASFLEKVDKEIDARVDARLAGRRQPAPPAERDDLRTLLKGVAVGIGASSIAFLVVGGNAAERLHRVLWVLLLLVVICTAAAGWAGRRLGNGRAAIPRPGSRPSD
jgi:hypothetical protein